ncbi:MAG TPA: LysR substrate-binding domain-containing protein [Steroidobacteraceae bacterium]|nr:LysR substrate-binding domain-containing protein [Steroidobacteraceae bacterium]
MSLRPAVLPALGVFAAAARHQNFAHAAQELHLTASAVSHHVRRLEATLGVALFQRHARGVTLTAEGRALADAATAALSDLDAVSRTLRGNPRNITQLRITTLHSLTYSWLLPRLSRFTAAHPQVRIGIETGIALTRFDESGPDLGIRYGTGSWPGLIAHYLMDDTLFPVASPRLAGIDEVAAPVDIARLPLVSDLALQGGWRDWFRAAGVRGARLSPTHTFSDSTDAMQAAVCGIGAALARARIVAPYLQTGELVRLPGPAMKARFAYYAVYPSHRRPSAAATAFVEWLRREAAQDDEAAAFTGDAAVASRRAPGAAAARTARRGGGGRGAV